LSVDVPSTAPSRHERIEIAYPGFFDRGGKIWWLDGKTGDDKEVRGYDPHRRSLSGDEIRRQRYNVRVYEDARKGITHLVVITEEGVLKFFKKALFREKAASEFPVDDSRYKHVGDIEIKVCVLPKPQGWGTDKNSTNYLGLSEAEMELFSYNRKITPWHKDASGEAGRTTKPLWEREGHVIGSIDIQANTRGDHNIAQEAFLMPASVCFTQQLDSLFGVQTNKGRIDPPDDISNQIRSLIKVCKKDLNDRLNPPPPPPPPPPQTRSRVRESPVAELPQRTLVQRPPEQADSDEDTESDSDEDTESDSEDEQQTGGHEITGDPAPVVQEQTGGGDRTRDLAEIPAEKVLSPSSIRLGDYIYAKTRDDMYRIFEESMSEEERLRVLQFLQGEGSL